MPDAILKLHSGRNLAYAEYGDPEGLPLFFFHGWPSSRLQGEILQSSALKLGIRVIAPDRPGIGLSDFEPNRRLIDWPCIIEELAQHLGFDRFHLLGVSGGGPYALVTARALPDRVLGAMIVCGAPALAEFGKEGLLWAYRLAIWSQRNIPFALALGLRAAGWAAGRALNEWPMNWFSKLYPAADREALSDPLHHRVMMLSSRQALFGDAQALTHDGLIYCADWGFDLSKITVPVHFWHGDADANIPLLLAQKTARAVPGAKFTIMPDDGHFSLPLLRTEQILRDIIA